MRNDTRKNGGGMVRRGKDDRERKGPEGIVVMPAGAPSRETRPPQKLHIVEAHSRYCKHGAGWPSGRNDACEARRQHGSPVLLQPQPARG